MNTVVLGLAVGDEGKGKIVDYITPSHDIICRFAGGCNAGHTIIVDGKKTILRLLPSGVLHADKLLVIGQGVVVDFAVLYEEVKALEAAGVSIRNRLAISKNAHVIMPYHISIDSAREEFMKIGTTKKGIGPTYEDKVRRTGVRCEDLLDNNKFISAIRNSLDHWDPVMLELNISEHHEGSYVNKIVRTMEKYVSYFDANIMDTTSLLNGDQSVLFEGAQGTLLDIDCGTYPFITSSSCTIGGVLTGAGVSHKKINKVIGVTKAYTTRVGAGEFMTEINGAEANLIREVGKEYGSVTKRPRRIGWLDLPSLKYACTVNGVDELVITKMDVLSGLENVKACYEYGNGDFTTRDYQDRSGLLPNYESFAGWTATSFNNVNLYKDVPLEVRNFVDYVQDYTGVKVSMICNGPEREKIIKVEK